jgi:methyl-accepting chemotaxis protein
MLNWLVLKLQRLTWPISRKLWCCFGFIFILFALNGSLIFTIQLKLTDLDNHEGIRAETLRTIQELRRDLKSQGEVFSEAIFITGNKAVNDSFAGQISSTLQKLRQQRELFGVQGARQMDAFSTSYRQVLINSGRLRDLINRDLSAAQQEWAAFSELFKVATADLDSFFNSQVQLVQGLTKEKSDLFRLNLYIIGASLVLTLALGALVAWLFSRCVSRPLRQIQVYLDRIAEGDLSGHVQIANRDELGRLAYVLNRAIANLREVIGGVRVSENLKELAQHLASSSHQQATGSNEQLYNVQHIIGNMQELTLRAEQISHSVESVAEASELSARRTADLNAVANEAGQVAGQMQTVVSETIESMAAVGETVVNLAEGLNQLSAKSRQINTVVEIISGIANEVHLLALNAAIEAAGAGQHGERFKVVANEIRGLANRTKDSTSQISALIQLVQRAAVDAQREAEQTSHKAQSVTLANQNLVQAVAGMNVAVLETVTVAGQIYDAAREVDYQVATIRQAVQDQMKASFQVNEALHGIGKMAQENAVVSEKIASSTGNLDEISARLVTIMGGISLT